MKLITPILLLGSLAACTSPATGPTALSSQADGSAKVSGSTRLNYPDTRRGEVIDQYFGSEVADPYRWLEDDLSDETAAWVKAQNEVTFGYLENIPYRDEIADKLSKQLNYERVSSPFKEGGYTYFYKNDGLQNHSVVYRQKDAGEADVFLDPNTFSKDATTSLAQLSFSDNGAVAAYAVSEGGSDWRKIIVIDTQTKEQMEEPLVDVKFSGISWYKNEGFYYSSYDKPQDSELSAKTDQHKLYYHKLGTSQSEDQLVFGGTREEKHRYVAGYVTEDNRYLVVTGSNTTSGNNLRIKDLSKPESDMIIIVDHEDSDSWVVDNIGSQLLIQTNLDAPNVRLVSVDAESPRPVNWQDVIAEKDHVLSVSTGGGFLFASYMIDATSRIFQFDYQGQEIREVVLPGLGSATQVSGKRDDQELYYEFDNYVTPGTLFSLNAKSGESSVYRQSGSNFSSAEYLSKQVFYRSKDGTQIPMIITYKNGVELDGSNPTMLYGYGGFNVSLMPSFSDVMAVWLEAGGVYAVANLRGGGEYGKAWHDQGRLLNKQNVFDDFIAAAEYLIDNNYTSSQKLAIRGGSNGGLLVAAAMSQRPELFKVALPAVGVLDMLRYHTFTAGAGWAYDYGTAEQSKEMFDYLKSYSPLHNLKGQTHYPATLVTTADHDDRVVPAHSFKFAAELQSKQASAAPTLIRIETNAGHGAGMSIDKRVALFADIFAFTFDQMGIDTL